MRTKILTPAQWGDLQVQFWPPQSKTDNVPLVFKDAPAGSLTKFRMDYKTPTGESATLLDILNGNLASYSFDPDLARETVGVLLNTLENSGMGTTSKYPLSVSEVIRLFNGVMNGGVVEISPTYQSKMWTPHDVVMYFRCLNGSGSCN